MKRSLTFLLLGLSACSSASAPAGPPPSLVTPLMLQPPPIYALLGHRETIELSSEQIVSLDSIAVGLRNDNDDLIDELEERSSLTRNQTALIVDEEGKPILEQIRDNNRGAAEAVGRVLTTTQQEETCEIFRRDREERSRGTRQRRPRVRGADQAAADSIWQVLQTSSWPWCAAAAQANAPADSGR
jgi:hypothetical protein